MCPPVSSGAPAPDPSVGGVPATSAFLRALRRFVLVEPHELRATLLAAGYFFFVLASYYVLRPIRDEMGVLGGVRNLAWLFAATLGVMLAVHPFFGALVSRTGRARFIPLSYRFFALSLVGFYAALAWVGEGHSVWVGRAFFVWTSVFNLFVVSIFWAFLVDLFRPEQAKRLFGFVAVGGTLGAIVGASVTAGLVGWVGPAKLLLVSALLLEVAVRMARALGRSSSDFARPLAGQDPVDSPADGQEPLGGSALEGLRRVATSPYLAQLCLFVALFTIGSTFLYFQQAQILAAHLEDSAARTALFAGIDLAVNVLTLLAQLFLTGRILGRIGIGAGLLFLPLLSVLGFGLLAFAPVVPVLVVFQVLRRAGNFAIMRPSREVLFTVLARTDKYKAKNVIDTFVYRLGDQLGAWSFALLGAIGLGLAGTAAAASAISVTWVFNALWLARRHRRRESPAPVPPRIAAAAAVPLSPAGAPRR